MRSVSTAPSTMENDELMPTDDERDQLSSTTSPSRIASPSPTSTRPTRTLRARRPRTKPLTSKAQVSQAQAQATPSKGRRRSRAAARNIAPPPEATPSELRTRRATKRDRTPDESDIDDSDMHLDTPVDTYSEGEDDGRPGSRARSLSIIPTVAMPPLTHPAPDDVAVRALGLAQSAKPGATPLTLDRDHLVRMREGHFQSSRPPRKQDENRNWKVTMSEAAWVRFEEVGGAPKGRAWTCYDAYDEDGKPIKPELPYVLLTKLVIASSPRKMLTLNQIYEAMEQRWPAFTSIRQTFRNSIRHSLSMNSAFVNVERPLSEGGMGTGKGGYWKVSDDTSQSHRGRAKKKARLETDESRTAMANNTHRPHTLSVAHSQYPPPPPHGMVHMPSSHQHAYPYPNTNYAAAHPPPHPSEIAYALPRVHCSPYRPSYYRAGREHYERSTALPLPHDRATPNTIFPDGEALLSPASLPEASRSTSPGPRPGPSRRTSSMGSPARMARISQPRPRHAGLPPPSSPPSLRSSTTHSPPDYKITTPPYEMSSLMQLATAAEESDHAIHTKARLDATKPPQPRLPSLRTLLNPSEPSRRGLCG